MNTLLGKDKDIERLTPEGLTDLLDNEDAKTLDDPCFERRELNEDDSILSCSLYWNTYSLLYLKENAIAYSPGFSNSSPHNLTTDSWFVIKTESGELYFVGDEPERYESFEELVNDYDDPSNIVDKIRNHISTQPITHILRHM